MFWHAPARPDIAETPRQWVSRGCRSDDDFKGDWHSARFSPNMVRVQGQPWRKVHRVASLLGLVAVGIGVVSSGAHAQQSDPEPRPMSAVIDRVVTGDIVMAANANVRGGIIPDSTATRVADVDRDRSMLCVRRAAPTAACADNSSAARLAIPRDARLVQARLYIETTLSAGAGQLGVRIAGPEWPREYTKIGPDSPTNPMLHEAETELAPDAVMRQAVWDVTEYVAEHGGGRYTIADIVSEAAGPDHHYASWAIVGVYELDPDVELDELSTWQQAKYAPRVVSWYDGFVPATVVDVASEPESDPDAAAADGPLPGPLANNLILDDLLEAIGDEAIDAAAAAAEMAVPDGPAFAKSLHIVATGRSADPGNLLYDGRPLGSNLSPGDAPPPTGSSVGDEPACNSTSAVFNDTICVLGRPLVATSAAPGYVDGGTNDHSYAAVDTDVIRVPDHYLTATASTAELEVFSASDEPVMVGMLALSVDVPDETSDVLEEAP